MSGWFDEARAPASRGGSCPRPGSLAGLAEARRHHLGQFFTPQVVAGWLWGLVVPAIERACGRDGGRRVNVYDPAVGTGRLLQFAESERDALFGVDVDTPVIESLVDAAESAGLAHRFIASAIEHVEAGGFDVAVVNPPFGITLESPVLDALACTTHGRYGPNTRAVSHRYFVEHALSAATVVAAIVPRSYADELLAGEAGEQRLVAVFHLPSTAFREAGATVATSIVVFGGRGAGRAGPVEAAAALDEAPPDLGLGLAHRGRAPVLRVRSVDDAGPAITTPVSHDPWVRVTRNGRRLVLRFACGSIEARVLNAVYRDLAEPHRPPGHRHPRGVRYIGEGALDVEVHLVQPDPVSSVERLVETIRDAGGQPCVDAAVWRYLRRRMRRLERTREPLHRVVYDDLDRVDSLEATAWHTAPVDPDRWGSPVVRAGETVTLEPSEGGFWLLWGSRRWFVEANRVYGWLQLPRQEGHWREVAPGLQAAFPQQAAVLRRRAHQLGLSEWLWPYQLDDLIEVALNPGGAVVAWRMGLGKARLALALALLSGDGPALVCSEPDLVEHDLLPKMLECPRPSGADIRVIRSAADLNGPLARVNLIAYNLLRSPVSRGTRRPTFAKRLRGRIATLIADEGDVLCNPESQQARALWQVRGRRRFALTGTPAPNYPRDVFPLVTFVGRDGRADQVYGWYRGYIEARLRSSMAMARRGVDVWRERFVTVQWVTNPFAEDLRTGAKREIPAIGDVAGYRAALGPWVKRRVHNEPDVAPYAGLPDSVVRAYTVDWDPAHLRYYLQVAWSFRSWYQQHLAARAAEGRASNLVAVLARIMAVRTAAGAPQLGVQGFGAYTRLTSKQRWIIDRVAEHVGGGHQVVVLVWRPGHAERLADALECEGLGVVRYHGERAIGRRMRELREGFRTGAKPVLVATLAAVCKGKDIPEASRVIMAERDWTERQEIQAIYRTMRPQQAAPVVVETPHLAGSIDEYMDQMVAHKRDALAAGIDWATPSLDETDFEHIDTLLGRFCRALAEDFGVELGDLGEHLASIEEGPL